MNLGYFISFEMHHIDYKCCQFLRYIHNQDWDNAERVAEQHDKSAMSEVLLSRAKFEFEATNYPRFEALMLRCHKPELIVKQYQVLDYYEFYILNNYKIVDIYKIFIFRIGFKKNFNMTCCFLSWLASWYLYFSSYW